MSGNNLAQLRTARAVRQGRLLALPNVVGTGLGIKRRGDDKVGDAAVVVFVEQKLDTATLKKADRVPAFLKHAGHRIPTDVVEINNVRPEFGTAPYFLSDVETKGTVSTFARDEQYFYASSCAHCLAGPDHNPHTSSAIGIWDGHSYIPVGENVFAIQAPGYGMPGNFGFSDAGLVILKHPDMIQRARNAPPLGLATALRKGMVVGGQTPTGNLVGTIDAIEATIYNYRTDLLIRLSATGTVPGNSGMLWRTQSGQAAGIHAFGAQYAPDQPSRYSLAMLAARAASQLQVEFLDPGWRQ